MQTKDRFISHTGVQVKRKKLVTQYLCYITVYELSLKITQLKRGIKNQHVMFYRKPASVLLYLLGRGESSVGMKPQKLALSYMWVNMSFIQNGWSLHTRAKHFSFVTGHEKRAIQVERVLEGPVTHVKWRISATVGKKKKSEPREVVIYMKKSQTWGEKT